MLEKKYKNYKSEDAQSIIFIGEQLKKIRSRYFDLHKELCEKNKIKFEVIGSDIPENIYSPPKGLLIEYSQFEGKEEAKNKFMELGKEENDEINKCLLLHTAAADCL